MMKRVVITLLALTMVWAMVEAQTRLRNPEIYFGVNGGVIASTTTFNPTVENMTPFIKSVMLSGTGGFIFQYNGQKYCGVQVEANYMPKGWREGGYQRTLHYVELPMMMHLYFGSPNCRFIVNAGPQIGVCVYDDTKQAEGNAMPQRDKITNIFDWGIVGGLGINFRTVNCGAYQVEARLNYSFGNLYSDRATDYFAKSNTMALSINLAWMWEFKKKDNKKDK